MRERFVKIVLRRRIDGLSARVIQVVAKSLVKGLLGMSNFSDILEIRYHPHLSFFLTSRPLPKPNCNVAFARPSLSLWPSVESSCEGLPLP